MQDQSRMESLVARLHEQKSSGTPFTLVLGAGLGKAAGVPSFSAIAGNIFSDLYARDPQAAQNFLPEQTLKDLSATDQLIEQNQLKQALFELLANVSSLARYSLLQRYYSQIPVPRFYQDLARMIRDGYFHNIVTENPDNLLEEALNGAGLQRGLDYQVEIPEIEEPDEPALPETPVIIFRLPAELASLYPDFDSQKIINTLNLDSTTGMLICGYDFQHADLNQVIRSSQKDIWLVDPEANTLLFETNNQLYKISGPLAEPNRFFGFLNLLLDQKKGIEIGEQPKIEQTDPKELESIYLKEQLRRSKNVLAQLEQEQVFRGEADGELRTQIVYQQEQIYDIENRLRQFQASDQRIVELLAESAQQAKNAGVDHDTFLYLNYQARAVRRELEKEVPSQAVIHTTVSATLSLLERLPAETVSKDIVHQLAELVPPFTEEA